MSRRRPPPLREHYATRPEVTLPASVGSDDGCSVEGEQDGAVASGQAGEADTSRDSFARWQLSIGLDSRCGTRAALDVFRPVSFDFARNRPSSLVFDVRA